MTATPPPPETQAPAADHQAVPAARPLAAAALAAACFVGMDATAKHLGSEFSTVQVTWVRFAAGSLFAVPLWLWWRTPMPAAAQWPWHGLRAALLLVALLSWFFSLTRLPLVQALGVGYTAPIFIALLAMLVLGERPGRSIWLALGLGLAGVGVALWPELSGSAAPGSAARVAGLVLAAVSSVSYAGVVVVSRRQAQRDALWTILLVQNLLPLALLALPAAWLWQPMDLAHLGPALLMGALATLGLLAMTWAFTHIEASRAAPMEYTGMVWGALLGYGLFGEVPTVWNLASAALILLGCVLLLPRRRPVAARPASLPTYTP